MSTLRRRLTVLLAVVGSLPLVFLATQRESSDDSEFAPAAPNSTDIQPIETVSSPPTEFSAADLQLALNTACSDDVEGVADKEWTREKIQAQIDAFNQQKQRLSERLAASSSAEHLHLAALLEEDPVLRFELLNNAISHGPSDPYLLWGAVQICSEAAETMPCPLRDWEQLLIAVDGQNSESWVRVAANKYAANDRDAALQAMRYAATAAESRAYWTETVEMVERGLAAGGDFAFSERAGMAFSIAASELPRYGDYVRMCEENSAQSPDWAYTCLAYGELVENQGKTEMGVSIARSIQKVALERMGELEKAAQVQQRIEAHRQERIDSAKARNPTIERLIFSNPNLFSSYLAAIRSVGEHAARRKIAADIERIIEQQPNLACDQVNDR